jgi:hypothetical protein
MLKDIKPCGTGGKELGKELLVNQIPGLGVYILLIVLLEKKLERGI